MSAEQDAIHAPHQMIVELALSSPLQRVRTIYEHTILMP